MEVLSGAPRTAIADRLLDRTTHHIPRSVVGVVYYALTNDDRSHCELCEMCA